MAHFIRDFYYGKCEPQARSEHDGSWSSDDDYDNVSMIEYEGITMQLGKKQLYSAEGDELSDIGYRVKWVDSRNNSVFVLHMSGSPYDCSEEIIGIANSIITVN